MADSTDGFRVDGEGDYVVEMRCPNCWQLVFDGASTLGVLRRLAASHVGECRKVPAIDGEVVDASHE